MKKVLIFGGSGFIGSALANKLSSKYEVTIFDNNERKHSLTNVNKNIAWIKNDICDYESVLNAIRGNDIVYNLAYINGTENFYTKPGRILEIAGLGQLNVGRAINKVGVDQFIYASSSEAYQLPEVIPTPEDVQLVVPDPANARFSYGGGKIFGELLTLHHVTNVNSAKIFRPHNIYGANMGKDHVIPQIALKIIDCGKTNEIEIQGSGKETRSFCHIEDAVRGIQLIQEKGDAGIFHLGSGCEVSILELIKTMQHILKKEVNIIPGPLTPGSVSRRCPNISKLKTLGFEPMVSLEAGLKQFIANDRMVLRNE